MAKRKSHGGDLDAVVDASMTAAQERWGERYYTGGAEETRFFCLSAPLGLQIVLQLPGIPLSRFFTIVGPTESYKSSMAFEVCRIFKAAGGGYSVVETEDKDSSSMRKAIAGYDEGRFDVLYVEFVEEWMAALEYQITRKKEDLESLKPPCSVPWAFVVDSLGGVTTRKIGEKIDELGSAELVQPHSANIISTYMKRMIHWMDLYPMSVFAVNHLKLGQDRHGNANVRNIQGGTAPRFHETTEIEMYPLGKQAERREPRLERYRKVVVKVAKNSAAQHGPPLEVEVVWWFEPNPVDPEAAPIQRTFFDWYTATIEYLLDPELPSQMRQAIKKVLDLQPSRKSRTLSCEQLGVPEKEPVGYRQAGWMLEQRKDLVDALRPALGIRSAFLFEPGSDIRVQREEARARVVRIAGDLGGWRPPPERPQSVESRHDD